MKTYITKKILEMVAVSEFKSGSLEVALEIRKVLKSDSQFKHLSKELDNNLLNDLSDFLDGTRTTNSTIQKHIDIFKSAEMKVQEALKQMSSGLATNPIRDIISIMKDSVATFYVVGGTVRDVIANKDSNDVDFCTGASLNTVRDIFNESDNFIVKETGKQFLVLNVIHKATKTSFEIAHFRKDKDNSGGVGGTMLEDSMRRDFTNSSLYYNINTKTLVDPLGNLGDALNDILRFNGDPDDRINEDPLRVIRFYKFIDRGFKPDNKSLKAVRRNFEKAINEVSKTRLMVEIEKIAGVK